MTEVQIQTNFCKWESYCHERYLICWHATKINNDAQLIYSYSAGFFYNTYTNGWDLDIAIESRNRSQSNPTEEEKSALP